MLRRKPTFPPFQRCQLLWSEWNHAILDPMIFRVVSDVDWSYSRPEKMTFKIKLQSKNDFLYVPSVETSLLIHMSFHTDGHKIIRSRYWWNFSISTQSRFFPKHPVSKKSRFYCIANVCASVFFLHPFLSTVKTMKPLRGRGSLAQQGWRWRVKSQVVEILIQPI